MALSLVPFSIMYGYSVVVIPIQSVLAPHNPYALKNSHAVWALSGSLVMSGVAQYLDVGQASEIHAPGVGIVPVPAGDPRYIFHDIASRRYWGRWDAAAREIRYPDARRRGDDDDDAIPMGFGVGHPSFKAAFPVSESWGS